MEFLQVAKSKSDLTTLLQDLPSKTKKMGSL